MHSKCSQQISQLLNRSLPILYLEIPNPFIPGVFLGICILFSSVNVGNSTYIVSVYREDGPEEKDFQFLFLETEIKNSWEAYFEDAKQKLGKN